MDCARVVVVLHSTRQSDTVEEKKKEICDLLKRKNHLKHGTELARPNLE